MVREYLTNLMSTIELRGERIDSEGTDAFEFFDAVEGLGGVVRR